MSNAMSNSKSRWKGALLAAVAGAAVSPMMAKAQSVSVSLGVVQNGNTYTSNAYVDPFDPVTINVYATVTGTAAPSGANPYGLDYVYFNVNGATTNGATGLGNVSSSSINANFNTLGGTQVGNLSSGLISSPATILGDSSGNVNNYILIAKPRAAEGTVVPYNAATGVTVSGNSVTYLVDTMTYTPNSTAVLAHSSTPAVPNVTTFNVSIPTLSSTYPSANFQAGGAVLNTFSSAVSSLTLTNALPGDTNLDGTVNSHDLTVVLQNFGNATTSWANGNFNGTGSVNSSDLTDVLQQFGNTLGGGPSVVAADAALLADPQAVSLLESYGITPVAAVPEPSVLALAAMGLVPLLRRRRSAR